VPVVFYIAREVTSQIDGLNPATVLSMQIFYGIKYGDWNPLNEYWIFIVGPIIGAISSGIFFNYFFLPLFIRWKAKK